MQCKLGTGKRGKEAETLPLTLGLIQTLEKNTKALFGTQYVWQPHVPSQGHSCGGRTHRAQPPANVGHWSPLLAC
jgi:hypothetical protein